MQARTPVRVAALETLGYICQDLPAPEKLEKSLSDQILLGLLSAIAEKDVPEVRRRGLTALTDGIAFCETNFKNS